MTGCCTNTCKQTSPPQRVAFTEQRRLVPEKVPINGYPHSRAAGLLAGTSRDTVHYVHIFPWGEIKSLDSKCPRDEKRVGQAAEGSFYTSKLRCFLMFTKA